MFHSFFGDECWKLKKNERKKFHNFICLVYGMKIPFLMLMRSQLRNQPKNKAVTLKVESIELLSLFLFTFLRVTETSSNSLIFNSPSLGWFRYSLLLAVSFSSFHFLNFFFHSLKLRELMVE